MFFRIPPRHGVRTASRFDVRRFDVRLELGLAGIVAVGTLSAIVIAVLCGLGVLR